MAIKKVAHSAQSHLHARTGCSFKRSHVYELLAAAFGYRSYASLRVDSVFAERQGGAEQPANASSDIRGRCIELGYGPAIADNAASALVGFIAEQRVDVVDLWELLESLPDEMLYWDEGVPPHLLESLESAANEGNGLAHYVLAVVYREREEPPTGSEYWYSQAEQGRVLTGVQKEWADDHACQLRAAVAYEHHLREAGRLGNELALLDLAEFFDDPSFFEQVRDSDDHDPSRVVEIAKRLGRRDQAHEWLKVAALGGDTDAMRHLVEEFDSADLPECWTWVYLSQLLGSDMTKDETFAINNDGSPYDDAVGGAVFVDGVLGVRLAPLDAAADLAARRAARELFERMPSAE